MRKVIGAIIAALIGLFGLFGVQLHLVAQIDPANIIGAILIIGVWVFTEFKNDWADFREGVIQSNKWGDPSFWVAAITAVILPLLNIFNISLSAETISIISSILAVIVPVLLKIFRKTETNYRP